MGLSGFAPAQVLLDDTWADGSRAETSLPNESAVYTGISGSGGGALNTTPGTLAQTVATDSMKIWTHFATDGNEVNVGVGQQLVATVDFILKGQLYDNTSRSFRLGLFNDPTNAQVLTDVNDDGGGTDDPWQDSTGYQVQIPFTGGPGSTAPMQIFKRVNTNTSLGGSGGAYSSSSSGGTAIIESLDTPYTLTFELDRVSSTQMDITVSLADGSGVLSTHTVSDQGVTFTAGSLPDSGSIYTTFEHMFIRTSNQTSVANGIDYKRFKVELIPEPSALALLSLGGLTLLRRRR
jgi:hypothetical protein